MPTCKGRPYLLGESSESNTNLMDPQLAVALADIKAKFDNLIKTVETSNQKLKKKTDSQRMRERV